MISVILPSDVYVRAPVGLEPYGASFLPPSAVEAEADTSLHVPTTLSRF
jgi:hypothetical protein